MYTLNNWYIIPCQTLIDNYADNEKLQLIYLTLRCLVSLAYRIARLRRSSGLWRVLSVLAFLFISLISLSDI